jgi:RNA-splicing ligase RtcB
MNTKIYAKTIEEEAKKQVEKLSACAAYKDCKIRIMPDVHAGTGCTIGTTIKIKDKIIPNTVGVDISCGMLVVYLGNINIDLNTLDCRIKSEIPCGFNIHDNAVVKFTAALNNLKCKSVVDIDIANKSIGTLGGGNHFIELDVDDSGNKYLVIHSGSRNLGVRVCNYYQNLATASLSDNSKEIKELIEKYKAEGREKEISKALKSLPKNNIDKNMAYLEGDNMKDYLFDMKIIETYASLNRNVIAADILRFITFPFIASSRFETLHNYIDIKNKILRKGAVSAKLNEHLIIPMNMRDGSLLCIGKGNPDWNYSAPHGAGRLMSRKKANETLSINDFKNSMNGIYSTSVCESTIDESPMAYKSMDEIIECIKDTVDIVKVIKPIYNFKAT